MISVIGYLNKRGYQFKRHGDELIGNCPQCEDKERKFSVNANTGAYNCLHLNKCGIKGSFYDLQRLYGDDPERLDTGREYVKPLKKKSYTKPQIKQNAHIHQDVIAYLANIRKFTHETLTYFKVFSPDNHTAAVPYIKNGETVNVKYRDIIEKRNMRQEKNAEPCLFNRDRIYDTELIITEGEYDAMALYQYGIDAVSVPAGASNYEWIDTEWEYLETFSLIYLCLDGDEAGIECTNRLISKLGAWRCKVVSLPCKDANECLIAAVSKEKIQQCFRDAADCKPAMLSMPSQFKEEVRALFRNQDELNGDVTPWERLNKILKGWRPGEVTIWSGRSGAGKSTILNQVILDLAGSGIKSCVASLEMPPRRYLRWAVIQHLSNPRPHESEVMRAMDWFDGRIYIINSVAEITKADLLELFEYAARRYNVTHFVVDSLMKVALGGKDDLKDQKDFVLSIVGFAKRFHAHVHLVAHPRKGMKDSDRPGKVDVSGTSDITNLADNVLVMWRPDDEEKELATKKKIIIGDAMLSVKKNREFGYEGSIKLVFDESTRKFHEGVRA